MRDLDLRLVRYFVTVAKTRHFTRAAAALYISQPALSQGIAKLEKDLGLQLLVRDNRSVELTPAGVEFLARAEELLSAADATLSVAYRAKRDQQNLLRIGFIPAPGNNMGRIIAAAEELAPSATFQTRRLDWGEQEGAVVTGRVDVSFARAPITSSELQHLTVDRECRVAVVPEHHRLADRATVSIADLAGEPAITSNSCPSEEWRLWWAVAPRADGIPVVWGPAVDTIEELLQEVSRGHGVCITAESVGRNYQHDDVRFIPIDDVEKTTVDLCWLKNNRLPVIEAFVHAARSVLGASAPV